MAERLEEIHERLAGMSQWPKHVAQNAAGSWVVKDGTAQARDDMRWLLDEVRELREELADARTIAHGPNRTFLEERGQLKAEVERLRGVVARARGRVEMMRECSEASLEHLEGLHRAPAARAIREADRALAELEGKP